MCLCFYWKCPGGKLLKLLQRGCHIWFYHPAPKFSSIIVPCASFPQLGIDATVDSSCGPAPSCSGIYGAVCWGRKELLKDSSCWDRSRDAPPPWTAPVRPVWEVVLHRGQLPTAIGWRCWEAFIWQKLPFQQFLWDVLQQLWGGPGWKGGASRWFDYLWGAPFRDYKDDRFRSFLFEHKLLCCVL